MSHTAKIRLGERKGKEVVVVCGECSRATVHEVLTDVGSEDSNPEGDIQVWDHYLTLQCRGCRTLSFCHETQCTEDIDSDNQLITTRTLFPGRIIEDESEDMGRPEEHDVRDGVVQESAIRERSENKPYYVRNPDEKIASLKKEVDWHKLDSWGFRGFKYSLLSKKLKRGEARRFLRQELERLKLGTAAA